jgi:O-6-methylguanine DNA methyltransferase
MTDDLERALTDVRVPAPPGTDDAVLLGTGLVDGAMVHDSPAGDVVVAFNPIGVVSVDLPDDDLDRRHEARFGRRLVEARPPTAWARHLDRALEAGRPGDLPLDLRTLTEFQRAVLGFTASIPRGEVRPYGWIAAGVGSPGATRAVGSVMAANPIPLIVPCHRVVRSDGRIGAYSLGGPDTKHRLLEAEGAEPDQLEDLARRGIRYLGSDTTGIVCFPTCRHARRITDAHRVPFRTLADAKAAGHRPCEVCRP